MIQGSNMTVGHKGMRKGISLVEMLVAIVLFGIIGTISYTYYKNYYDTSFAAKQLRVYTIVDQAAQLSNAFDLYNTKNGKDPANIPEIVTDRILTEVPVAQPFVTATGWELQTGLAIGTNDVNQSSGTAFIYAIDSLFPSNEDKRDYCNILNKVADTTWSYDTNDTTLAALTMTAAWARGENNDSNEMEYFSCDGNGTAGGYNYQMVFIKRASQL